MTDTCDFDQIQRCAAELNNRLPDLADRYTPLVVFAALAEHIGGSLFLSQDAQLCSAATARAIIERVREIAFGLNGPGMGQPVAGEPG